MPAQRGQVLCGSIELALADAGRGGDGVASGGRQLHHRLELVDHEPEAAEAPPQCAGGVEKPEVQTAGRAHRDARAWLLQSLGGGDGDGGVDDHGDGPVGLNVPAC